MSSDKRNQMLCYEQLDTDEWYTITLNPRNDSQYFTSKDRILDFMTFHNNYLKKSIRPNSCIMELYLEISKTGRLHYHGYVKIFNKPHFYINTIPYLNTEYQYEIDIINDSEKWFEYIDKQKDFRLKTQIMSPSISNSPMTIGKDFKEMTKDFFTHNINNM